MKSINISNANVIKDRIKEKFVLMESLYLFIEQFS